MSKTSTHGWYDPAEADLGASGIVAKAGGGQANGTVLTKKFNKVATVATDNDSVKLPKATVGLAITVINAGANSLNVFPYSGDKVNALAADAAYAMAATKVATFICAKAGEWNTLLTA